MKIAEVKGWVTQNNEIKYPFYFIMLCNLGKYDVEFFQSIVQYEKYIV